jgi:tetratricopeptide (TPR) repeat protein
VSKQRAQRNALAFANSLSAQGDHLAAAESIAVLLASDPTNEQLLDIHHACLSRAEFLDPAVPVLQRAVSKGARSPKLLARLAESARRAGDLTAALTALDLLLTTDPTNRGVIGTKADVLALLSRPEDCALLLEPFLDKEDTHPSITVPFAAVAQKLGRSDEAEQRLRNTLDHAELRTEDRSAALHALANLADKRQDYDAAFLYHDQAHQAAGRPWDADRFTAEITDLINAWPAKRIKSITPAPTPCKPTPIFVVSVPRTGSSLIEAILAAHPDVAPLGECFVLGSVLEQTHNAAKRMGQAEFPTDPASIASAGKALARAYAQRANKKSHISDKRLANFMWLHFISLLAPNARVIHSVRDPRDTAVSMFFQNFPERNAFSRDLRSIAVYMQQSARLINYWSSVLDVDILAVPYEPLTADPEAQCRKILDHCNLDWHPACTEFYKTDRPTLTASNQQVNQPMYRSSVERWRRYEKHLAPLFDALEATK